MVMLIRFPKLYRIAIREFLVCWKVDHNFIHFKHFYLEFNSGCIFFKVLASLTFLTFAQR